MHCSPGHARGALWQRVALPAIFILLLTGAATVAQTSGAGYTQAQAQRGASVYAAQCAVCHGTNLQGGSGPALTGSAFRTSINSSFRDAGSLLNFIRTQMPLNAPGSLSQADYLSVTAYVLSRNGIPASNTALSASNAAKLQLAGTRLVTQSQQPSNVEIVRVAAPLRKVWAPLPSGTSVNISDAMMRDAGSDSRNWLLHGKTYANDRYSALSQITNQNVSSLSLVSLVQTGFTASFETTPIVVNGVMYITTPVVNQQMKVMAVNAATGSRYWETTINLAPFLICCGPVNRGPAVAYGNVYVTTLDDRIIALDATNGAVRWQTRVANPSVGYSETMTPQVYDGKLIVGSAGGEWAIAGFVAAYDARNGKQLWRWNSTDPKSYAGDSWKRGGAMTWTTPAVDPKLGLVIFCTGNPNPDLDGTSRKGDNLWSDSIVALDVNTGKMRWYYQEVKHDVWDYDAVSPVVLFDVTVNGRTVPAAGEAGKVGWFFVVNRETGQLIRKGDPYVKIRNIFAQPTKTGVLILPGANGGAEWSPAAYSPQTHYAYVLAMDQLMKFTTHPAKPVPGQLHLGSAFTNVEPNGIQDGPMVAIDTETGHVAWTHMTPLPLMGGALATAGNLVFFGEGNGNFDALDAKTGQLLWHYNLGAGVNAPPITYEVDGTQYIAVAAGGNFQINFPYGDALAIFKLSGGAAQPRSSP